MSKAGALPHQPRRDRKDRARQPTPWPFCQSPAVSPIAFTANNALVSFPAYANSIPAPQCGLRHHTGQALARSRSSTVAARCPPIYSTAEPELTQSSGNVIAKMCRLVRLHAYPTARARPSRSPAPRPIRKRHTALSRDSEEQCTARSCVSAASAHPLCPCGPVQRASKRNRAEGQRRAQVRDAGVRTGYGAKVLARCLCALRPQAAQRCMRYSRANGICRHFPSCLVFGALDMRQQAH